jgi:hypothetical protein
MKLRLLTLRVSNLVHALRPESKSSETDKRVVTSRTETTFRARGVSNH